MPDGASRTGRAGVVSRLLALVLDLFVVVVIDLILVAGATLIRALFTQDVEVAVPPPPWGHVVTLFLLAAYMVNGWTVGGRTLGMILLGLRAVREDGGDIKLPRAIARALLYLVFPPGILWAAFSSKNASIQDLIVDTAVVYDRGHARTS